MLINTTLNVTQSTRPQKVLSSAMDMLDYKKLAKLRHLKEQRNISLPRKQLRGKVPKTPKKLPVSRNIHTHLQP